MIQVLSPDGISIENKNYRSMGAAKKALSKWVKRYAHQGYYRDNSWNKIPLDQLEDCCEIIDTNKKEGNDEH